MAMAEAEILTIVVNHNTGPYLGRCLDSLDRAGRGRSLEVLVIDNASTDGSPETALREHPDFRLIASPRNLGFARAVNLGLEASGAPLVLLLNPDTELTANALDALVAALAAHPGAGATACRLVHADGELQPSAFRFPTPLFECAGVLGLDSLLPTAWIRKRPWLGRLLPASGHFDDHTSSREVDFALAACLLLRREALAAIGGLDERYFLYYEDIDLGHALSAAGWTTWFTPEATVLHHEATSARRSPGTAFRERHHSRLLYFAKHHGWLANLAVRAAMAASIFGQLLARPLRAALTRRVASECAVTLPGTGDYFAALRGCWRPARTT